MLEIILLVCEDRSAYLLTVLRMEDLTCFSELEHMQFSVTQGVLNLKNGVLRPRDFFFQKQVL